MTSRCRSGRLALAVALVAGCASGTLGVRPEVQGPAFDGNAGGDVSVIFELRDEDLTECSVHVEFSTDNRLTWNDATVVGSSAGSVAGSTVTGIRPDADFSGVTIVWDSWADGLDRAVTNNVIVRVTPSDIDEAGQAAESAGFTVNNDVAVLDPLAGPVAFQYGLGAANPAAQTVDIVNSGSQQLSWSAATTYATGAGWLDLDGAAAASGTTAAAGTTPLSITADPIGQTLAAGAYTATVTVDDPAAHGSPQEVTVTLAVSAPVLAVAEAAGVTFGDAVQGVVNASDTSIHISNPGPAGTVLNWSVSETSASGWLTVNAPASGSNDAGAAASEVTLSADSMTPTLTAGTYTATIRVEDANATGSPCDITVTLIVNPPRPDVYLHDNAAPTPNQVTDLYFECTEGRANPASQPFWVENSGDPATDLVWSAASGAGWLSSAPPSGGPLADGASEAASAAVDNAGLASNPAEPVDDYVTSMTVSGYDPGTSEPAKSSGVVTVHLNVLDPPQIEPSAADVYFTGAIDTIQDPTVNPQSVTITNPGEVDLDWQVASVVYGEPQVGWLSTSPGIGSGGTVLAGGSDFDTLTLTAGPVAAGTPPGDYTATVTLQEVGFASNETTVTVHLNVAARAEISPGPGAMTFTMQVGGAAPAPQLINVWNTGGTMLNWTAVATSTGSWLSIAPPTGTCMGGSCNTSTVSAAAGRPEGTHTGTITITDANASNSPVVVNVTLNVMPPAIWVDALLGSDLTGTGTSANPYQTIGMAMSAAVSGELVMVRPGIYYEAVSIPALNITLKSEQGAGSTVILGWGSGNGVSVPDDFSGSGTGVVIDGFTITSFSTGVYAWCGAEVRDCVLEDNGSCGVFIWYGYGSVVAGNTSRYNGNGIRCGGSFTTGLVSLVTNNLVVNNSGYGIYLDSYGSMATDENVIAENNTVAYNGGNGISFWNSGAVILRNDVIAYNIGYGMGTTAYYTPEVRNCDVYNNIGGSYHVDVGDRTGTLGNISADPDFVNYFVEDFRIQFSSPCRDWGLNSATLQPTDIRGEARVYNTTVDMGCFEWTLGDP